MLLIKHAVLAPRLQAREPRVAGGQEALQLEPLHPLHLLGLEDQLQVRVGEFSVAFRDTALDREMARVHLGPDVVNGAVEADGHVLLFMKAARPEELVLQVDLLNAHQTGGLPRDRAGVGLLLLGLELPRKRRVALGQLHDLRAVLLSLPVLVGLQLPGKLRVTLGGEGGRRGCSVRNGVRF